MTAAPTPLLGRVARDGLMILHERAVKARNDGLAEKADASLKAMETPKATGTGDL